MANTETVKNVLASKRKNLIISIQQAYGRDSAGHISSRYKSSGGHRKLYRKISFRRPLIDIKGKVISIEYDPFRNCKIAFVHYENDAVEFILAPEGLKANDEILTSNTFGGDLKPGHAMPLKVIPIGTIVHNVEMKPGFGGKIARAAGTYVTLIDRNDVTAIVQLPSGETRMVPSGCFASIGVLSNADFINKDIGKAGRSRHLGVRPHVRGIAKNPVDHPHGGRTNGGRHPVTPWGKITKGLKTRKKKASDKMIIRRRNKKGN
jgi:large subunit ribosomal protein L2